MVQFWKFLILEHFCLMVSFFTKIDIYIFEFLSQKAKCNKSPPFHHFLKEKSPSPRPRNPNFNFNIDLKGMSELGTERDSYGSDIFTTGSDSPGAQSGWERAWMRQRDAR